MTLQIQKLIDETDLKKNSPDQVPVNLSPEIKDKNSKKKIEVDIKVSESVY